MAAYKPTQLSTLPKITESLSGDALFWKDALAGSKVVKEYGPINWIDLHPLTSDILVTSSRIALYNLNNVEEKRSYKINTPAAVYSATFRKTDGKLFVSGSDDGIVHVHDITESKPLRAFSDPKTRHVNAVKRCQFNKHSEVVSFSDDKSVKLWDIATADLVTAFGEKQSSGSCEVHAHSDYIRAGSTHENTQMIVSGSYDHTVKVWDVRCEPHHATHQFDIGHPVESVIFKDSLVIASGGKAIFVYDLVAKSVLTKISNVHSKTITCVTSRDKFLLSGSLDGQLRVYDNLFKPIACLNRSISNQILNMQVNDKCVAIGFSDGSLSVRKFKSVDQPHMKPIEPSSTTARVAKRARRYFSLSEVQLERAPGDNEVCVDDVEEKSADVERIRKDRGPLARRMASFDYALKKFDHSRALDLALQREQERPAVIVSLMQELIRRSALQTALAARSDKQLERIVDFVVRHIRDPKFVHVLIDVANALIECYEPYVNRSNLTRTCFTRLERVLTDEVMMMQDMKELAGQISLIISNAAS